MIENINLESHFDNNNIFKNVIFKNMKVMTIIVIVIIILIVSVILIWIYSDRKIKNIKNNPILLCDISDGNKQIIIPAEKIIPSNKNTGQQFSLSNWIYIKNWNIISNKNKSIIDWDDNTTGGLKLYLDNSKNDLYCSFNSIYNNTNHTDSLKVSKIPLQKWLNIVIIVENRDFDMFINGKLYKSLLLSVVPNIKTRKMTLCSNNGFPGYISNIKYYNKAISQDEIISLFQKGPNCKFPKIDTSS